MVKINWSSYKPLFTLFYANPVLPHQLGCTHSTSEKTKEGHFQGKVWQAHGSLCWHRQTQKRPSAFRCKLKSLPGLLNANTKISSIGNTEITTSGNRGQDLTWTKTPGLRQFAFTYSWWQHSNSKIKGSEPVEEDAFTWDTTASETLGEDCFPTTELLE